MPLSFNAVPDSELRRWSPEQLQRATFGMNPRLRFQYLHTVTGMDNRILTYSMSDTERRKVSCACCGSSRRSGWSQARIDGYQLHICEMRDHWSSSTLLYAYCDNCIVASEYPPTPEGEEPVLMIRGQALTFLRFQPRLGRSPLATEHYMAYNGDGAVPNGMVQCQTCSQYVVAAEFPLELCGSYSRCLSCAHRYHIESRRVIRGYHQGTPNPDPIKNAWSARRKGLFFGVELEVEMVNGRRSNPCGCEDEDCSECEDYNSRDHDGGGGVEREEVAQNILQALHANPGPVEDALKAGRDVVRFEEDGSLDHGFEIITLPFSLPDQRHIWRQILKDSGVRRELISHQTETCGLHIHVSRSALTTSQIARMNYFVNHADNEQLIRAVARRYNTSYARVVSKSLLSNTTAGDRYEMLNVCNRMTIEFRMFRGSCNPDAVIAALEFVNALVKYCEDGKPWWNPKNVYNSTNVDGHKAHLFLNYLTAPDIRRETKTLREYLKARGIHWTKSSWARARNPASPSAEG